MADSNPNKIIESLTKQPVRITNPIDVNANAPKVEKTLIHNPLTQGFTRESPEFKQYTNDIMKKWNEHQSSPEYKKYLMDAFFSDDDISFDDFIGGSRKAFLDKYGYDEDLGKSWIFTGNHASSSQNGAGPDLLDKRLSLSNALNLLSTKDIKDYFTQRAQTQKPSNPYQKGYQFRSNGFIRKPTPDDLINARTFDESGEPYNIGAVENLTPQQMREFLQHPLNDYEWVTRNLPNLTADEKNGWGTILIDDGVSPYGYIVDPQGSNYPRYVLPVKLR